jgi:hypothetical protein
MALKENIKFAYDEAAVIVTTGGKNYVVIGDLHIGTEMTLFKKGIKLYGAVEQMEKKIKSISRHFKAKSIIILGDVKDTILYPEALEILELKEFFKALDGYDITVVAGNHDAHLEEIVNCKMVDELVLGNFAFLHGHRWPSENAMKAKYLFAGHNHVAVSMKDKNGAFYNQKAWLVSKFNKKRGLERYPNANKEITLIVLPAFNDLITGMPVGSELEGENISPLFRNGVFDYKTAKVYSLRGDIIGTPSRIKRPKR